MNDSREVKRPLLLILGILVLLSSVVLHWAGNSDVWLGIVIAVGVIITVFAVCEKSEKTAKE